MAALSCSLSLDVEGQTDWWKPHLLLFFEFQCSSHSWVMRLGGSKCWFLPFLYFSSFVVFILQSLRSCKKVLYHGSQKLHLLLRCSPSPNASLPLERTTKVSSSFLAYFVENTVLHWYWFWNAADVGDFLSASLCFAPGDDLSMHCRNTDHSFARSPDRLLLIPSHAACRAWESCLRCFCFGPSRSFFYIIRMTLEFKGTFQGRLLMLWNLSLMRRRNLSLPN